MAINKTVLKLRTELKQQKRNFDELEKLYSQTLDALAKVHKESADFQNMNEALREDNALHKYNANEWETKFKNICVSFGARVLDGKEKVVAGKEVSINIDIIAAKADVIDIRSMDIAEAKALAFRLAHIAELAK